MWEQLGDHIMELSRNKCASNVIEKCLATGDRSEVRKWVDTLCTKHDKLAELMKDQFGNYVCFTAFLVCLSYVSPFVFFQGQDGTIRMMPMPNCLRALPSLSLLISFPAVSIIHHN